MKRNEDRLLTRHEVVERFGLPKRFLELAVSKGDGPRVIRVGRLVRYRVKDITAWIEANASQCVEIKTFSPQQTTNSHKIVKRDEAGNE